MGLIQVGGVHVREEFQEHDLHIVQDVYRDDVYRLLSLPIEAMTTVLDVGAHIGSFALHVHRRNPHARIVCVEAVPENLACLQANVGRFAYAISAACTYRNERLGILNSVHPGGGSTGGSMVVSMEEMNRPPRQADYDYLWDIRHLKTITLEEAMSFLEVDQVDLLKLDCEFSEVEILRNTPYPERIHWIIGEYHEQSEWEPLIRTRFRHWRYQVLDRGPRMGIFHLENPCWPPAPKTDIRERILEAMMAGDQEAMDRGLLFYDHLYRKVKTLRPRKVVELGTRAGYSALAMLWAGAERVIGHDNGCDPDSKQTLAHACKILMGYDFSFIRQDTRTIASLPECDLVLIDGGHDYQTVRNDLDLAARSGAGDILLDDVCADGEVLPAIQAWLGANKDWVVIDCVPVEVNRNVVHLQRQGRLPRPLRRPLRIAVPPGIGDSLWCLTKVPALLREAGTDRAIIDAVGKDLPRTKDFLELFDFVESSGYTLGSCMDPMKPLADEQGIYNYLPCQRHWNGYDWFLQANRHLEEGRRLEQWIPEYPIDWDIARHFRLRPEQRERAREFHESVGTDLALFYASSVAGNTVAGHNRGGIWRPADWQYLAERCLDQDIAPVFVGASWDENYWYDYLQPIMPPEVRCLIGQTTIGTLFALAQRCRFVVSYQSGIGIFSVFLGIPTVMWWRANGDSITPTGYVSFEEQMASAWAPPGSVERGRYLPLVYGRQTAEQVWEMMKEKWL